MHGGRSTGAKTQEGRAKIAAANMTNGQHTKAMIAKRKEDAKIAKELREKVHQAEKKIESLYELVNKILGSLKL